MSWSEIEHWVNSYNAWVETWNRHETSRDLPLSPEWPEAQWMYVAGRLPRSCLGFQPRASDRLGIIRVAGWRPYHPGWSFCRNPAAFERVAWAGWRSA